MTTERIDIVVSERGARTVSRNIKGIGTSAQGAQGSVQLLKRSLGLLGGSLILTGAIRTMANFSQAMSTVKAVSEATEDQFKSLNETAQELGATTRFTATQAAEGMTFLARAGFDANEVLSAIPDTLNLAQAGALDLARAADIASNVLKGFGLEAEETTRVVDVLAKTANSANTNVQQLGDAMSFAAPAAKAIGVEVELAAAAVGVLSDAGVQATRAGTGLRQIFIQLLSPTKKARDTLKAMGLNAADVNVQARGLIPVLETLRDKNIGLSQASALVGVRQATALLIMKDSIDRLKELNQENINAAGTAKRVADVMDDNLNGALLRVKSAFESVILSLGEAGAEGGLRVILERVAVLLRLVADNADVLVVALSALAIRGFIFLTKAVAGLTAALLRNPIGLLAVSATIAVSALVGLKDQILISADSLTNLGDISSAAFEFIMRGVSATVNFFSDNFPIISEFSREVFKDVELSLEGVLITAARVVDGTVGFFKGAADAIVIAFAEMPSILELLFVRSANLALQAFQDLGNVIFKTLNAIAGFAGLDPVPLLRAFKIKASTEAKEVGMSMDAALAAGIKSQNFAQEALQGILTRANEIARARLIKQQAAEAASADAQARLKTVIKPPPLGTAISTGTSFLDILKNLEDENRLLKVSNSERDIQRALLAATVELKRDLTTTEEAELEVLLRSNRALEAQNRVMEDIHGPSEEYKTTLEALILLLDKGKISTDEFSTAQRDLRVQFLETQTDLASGFERGLLKVGKNFEDMASVAENTVVNAFRSMEDALVSFVQTGKLDFKSLADSIIADLIRIQARAVISSVLKLFLGPSLPFLGPSLGTPGASALGAGTPFAGGGIVSGPGGPTDDLINTNLSNGEFVVNAMSTSKFLPLLQAINSGNISDFGIAAGISGNRPRTAHSSTLDQQRQQGGTFITIDARGSNGDEAVTAAVERGIRAAAPELINASVRKVQDGQNRDPRFF